jgi:integrase
MPLKLVKPREGKSPNWSIRGTYLGVRIDKSCGTDRRSLAHSILKRLESAIERGEYPPREARAGGGGKTFVTAAIAYMEAGHARRHIARLIKHFGQTPIADIDQATIDAAAVALHPNVTNATRNSSVYTPVSAILHHAGIAIKLRRPKGAKGRVVTDWLNQGDAKSIILAADAFDAEFGLLLRFLLYTGLRLGEVLALRWSDIDIPNATAWVRRFKSGIQSDVRLRADLRERLAAHGPQDAHRRVFRFRQGGHLKHQLVRAKLAALGLPCPTRRPTGWEPPSYRLAWANFHSFRHTFATWMRRAGTDVQGLVATGNWRDPRSAARYAHVVPREEWDRVDGLPSVEKTGNVA